MINKSKIVAFLSICLFVQLSLNFTSLKAQFVITKEEKEVIDKARESIKEGDIGEKLEKWINNMKRENVFIKILFLDNGLDIISDMYEIKKRIIKNGELLRLNDIVKIQSVLLTLDKICPAEDELLNLIIVRLNYANNKNWNQIIKELANSN